MKRNRLRQLVSWGYITQPEANQLWREYLRLFKRVSNQGGQKMTDKEKQLYELALKTGYKRFGSICEHRQVKNGHCVKCLRKVK